MSVPPFMGCCRNVEAQQNLTNLETEEDSNFANPFVVDFNQSNMLLLVDFWDWLECWEDVKDCSVHWKCWMNDFAVVRLFLWILIVHIHLYKLPRVPEFWISYLQHVFLWITQYVCPYCLHVFLYVFHMFIHIIHIICFYICFCICFYLL